MLIWRLLNKVRNGGLRSAWVGGDVRVLYLGGFGRSGSTLLERILSELPRHRWVVGALYAPLLGAYGYQLGDS